MSNNQQKKIYDGYQVVYNYMENATFNEASLLFKFYGYFDEIDKCTDKYLSYTYPNKNDLIEFFDETVYDISLSEKFILKYKSALDFNFMSEFSKLSLSFVDKYPDLFNWMNLLENHQIVLTREFIKKHHKRFKYEPDLDEYIIFESYKKSNYNIIKQIDNALKTKLDNKEYWDKLSSSDVYLPSLFIDTYLPQLNLNLISKYAKNLDLKYIENNPTLFNWPLIYNNKNINLSNNFIIKHSDKFFV